MRGLAITLVVLVALLVGADFAARAVAEDRVGAALQGPLQLPQQPEVDVHGFPFLAQALAGRYDDVELTGSGIRYGRLRDLTLSAHLQGVALPPDALLAGRVDAIPTDTVVAEARVGEDDLARLLDLDGVTVAPGDDPSQVRLTSTVSVAGRSVPVTATASTRLRGSRVTLAVRDVRPDGDAGAGGRVVAAAVRSRLTTSATVDAGSLPFGIRPTGVRAENGALVVSGTARNVDLLAAAA